MAVFRLAHLSDLHLSMSGIRLKPRHWLSKRFFSNVSWLLKRRKIHRPEILAAMIEDIAAAAPDHVAVTGDVTNLGLPEEFERSLPWLERLGDPAHVTVIPGNHDALVPLLRLHGLGRWQTWMTDDMPGEAEEQKIAAAAFPFLRRRGDVALIGVDTAVSTPLFKATGEVGEEQLAKLEALLVQAGSQGLFRVVLIHHPVAEGLQPERKALLDRAPFRAVLARAGAELVLHGHAHVPSLAPVPGPDGPIPTICVSSASSVAGDERHAARWHLYEIERQDDDWRLRVLARRVDRTGAFSQVTDYTIRLPAGRRRPDLRSLAS